MPDKRQHENISVGEYLRATNPLTFGQLLIEAEAWIHERLAGGPKESEGGENGGN